MLLPPGSPGLHPARRYSFSGPGFLFHASSHSVALHVTNIGRDGRSVTNNSGVDLMADVEAAAYALVHEYPGGAEALGAQTGIKLLSNKVNPNNDRNHLMLKEAVRCQIVARDHRIFMAEAEELGYAPLRLPDCEDADFGQAAMLAIRDFGKFIGTCEESLSDGKVSRNELRNIERDLLEAITHATRLHQLLAAKNKSHG